MCKLDYQAFLYVKVLSETHLMKGYEKQLANMFNVQIQLDFYVYSLHISRVQENFIRI